MAWLYWASGWGDVEGGGRSDEWSWRRKIAAASEKVGEEAAVFGFTVLGKEFKMRRRSGDGAGLV